MEFKHKVFLGLAAGLSIGLTLLFSRRKPRRSYHYYRCFVSQKLKFPPNPNFIQDLPFPKSYHSLTELNDQAKYLLCSHFLYSPITESTQTYLDQNFPLLHSGLLYVADIQTKGQGRTGNWESQDGCLMFSFKYSCCADRALTLQLAIPLAIIKAIHCMSISNKPDLTRLLAKYPNDVYLNGKKLAGVLVNSVSSGKNFVFTIGIGINVNNKTNFASLEKEFPGMFAKGELLKCFLEEFTRIVNGIEDELWSDKIVQEYKNNWMHLGKKVKIFLNEEDWIVRDINKQGIIFVENLQGKIEKIVNREEITFMS